jgi:hypothetical protein
MSEVAWRNRSGYDVGPAHEGIHDESVGGTSNRGAHF